MRILDNNAINRDASDKIKGFVLQKWRATELLIDTMLQGKYSHVYCAIEQFDDVYQRVVTGDELLQNFEQNKDYKSKLSFSSEEVKKSLVNFFDLWCRNELSTSIQFAFYTNTDYSKEKKTDSIERLKIDLPDVPIIELLIEKKYEYNNVLETAIAIFKDYYKQTYENSKKTGYVKTLDSLSIATWKTFFENIDWKFGQPDEMELKNRIINKIKQVKYYMDRFNESEEYIFSRITQLFDERLTEDDFLKKLVHLSEVENIFMHFMVGDKKEWDKAYKVWDIIPLPCDKRNLKDKILSVCKDYSRKRIAMHILDYTSGQIEMNEYQYPHSVSSYKYRIYEACKRYLIGYIVAYEKNEIELSEQDIENIFGGLFNVAKEHLEDKSKNYDYPFKDDDTIRKTIYILFDSCFLSFDNLE